MVARGLEELDPELKTQRQYTNLSAREVQAELIKRGYAAENVFKNDNDYPTGVIVPKQEMMQLNKRLQRSDSLRKYDILITPKTTRRRSNHLRRSPKGQGPSRPLRQCLCPQTILLGYLRRH